MKTPGAEFGWLRPRHVAWLGGGFITLIVALAVFDVVRGYREAVANTGRELDAQSRVIAEQTARGLQAVDVVLRHLEQQHRSGALAAMSPEALHRYLWEQAVGLVQIDGLVVFDTDGKPIAVSLAPPARVPAISVSGQEAFESMRSGQATGLMIGKALRSPGTGRWVFPIGRRLVAADGSFAGAVGAAGRIEYFQEFYRDAHPEPGTRVALVHRNGSLLARHPPAEESLGRRFPLVEQLIAASAPAPTRNKSPLDGVDRFGALRLVPDYPLAVVVTRDVATALAPWREQAIGTAVRTVGLGALTVFLLVLAQRQFARIESARASLATSQQRFALAAAGSDDGVWDWDFTSDVAFESARARELQGLPPGPELQPLPALVASLGVHPDDAPRREAGIRAHLAGQTPAYECEYRVRHPDGSWRWIRVRAVCVRDAAGQPLRMAGSVSDVDTRRRAEDALRASEERYALAMTGSRGGHWVWEAETDALFVSGTVNELFGLPAETRATTRTEYFSHITIHPDDDERVRRVGASFADTSFQRVDFEYRIVLKDGSVRWILTRAQAFRDAEGRGLRVAGVSVDVTERKHTEEALRRSEERYQLAIDGSNEGLWDWDLSNDMVFMSPRAQRLSFAATGEPLRPRKEWLALTHYHPDDLPRVRRAIVEHLRGESPHFEVEYRVRHHTGAWHWYRQRGVALRDESGRAYRMAGSMEDISSRKQAEAERERLERQLRQAQKLEAIGTLAGGIAHDFNNILSAILGYGELAQKDAPEGSTQRRHLDAAIGAGLRAKSLVERILAFSRSGMGERVPVHVASVLAEALDAVAASFPPGVKLERRIETGDAGVLGDPTQLHQVVLNLCANAVQAMRSAGVLDVRAAPARLELPLTVATSTLPPGDYLCLAVRDTGSGIAPELLDRIFDPFFTTKEVGVGTGLGLSLVHGIVTDLGGGVAVDSRPGEGSTFTVWLPSQPHAAPPVATDEAIAPGDGETILLVDDEEALVRLGEEMLAELGYEPVGFASSAEALQAFRAEPDRFDAVLSDEAMPGLTGSELIAQIRALRPALPIVLMSGFVSPALTARAKEHGVAEVLNKPLVSRDIARALAAALKAGEKRLRPAAM